MIYLNNAATTWPKPEIVYQTVDDAFRNLNCPERSAGADGKRGSALLQTCRGEVADFFGIDDCSRFVFTPSCTYSLNIAILCQDWQPGDVIIISGLEHHAVSRPVRKLAREKKVEFKVAPYAPGNPIDLQFVEEELKTAKVRLVACTMASNVTGEIFPCHEIGELCKKYDVKFLVDAAQVAGLLPVHVDKLNADFVAFSGHKCLFGPPGVGGLFVREGICLNTLAEGGTGQDTGEHAMSGSCPSAFEVGTHNLLGIVGVTAGVRWIKQVGLDEIRNQEQQLTARFIKGIESIPGIKIYGDLDPSHRNSVVSCTMDDISPQQAASWLADNHQIVTRAGYHCAPLAHETIGTLPGEGTVRFSFGFANTEEEVEATIAAVAELPRSAHV